jgi:hypothetical protein
MSLLARESRLPFRSGCRRQVIVAAAAMLLLVSACGESWVAESNRRRARAGTAGMGQGEWDRIPKAAVRYPPEGIFWIDGRLVVVVGSTIEAWDPANGWEILVRIPQADQCEGCGYSETAVWTGDEILLWGGGFAYKTADVESRGAAFDPRSGRLRALPRAPIRSRWWHTAVWTGEEMIVWGGGCRRHECRHGAAYDPRSDSWRRIADGPMPGYAHSVVWTGEEMIVWGGSDDYESEGSRGFPRRFLKLGAAYDPDSDTWRMLERAPLEPRGWHTAVWTGEEMIVWGGVKSPCTTAPCDTYPADAGAYVPATGDWREVVHGPLSGRVDHTAVWTGEEMIVWGGSFPGGGLAYGDGGIYDPAEDRWTMLPDSPVRGRYRHGALWTGQEMVIWGGQSGSGRSLGDGAIFAPDR